MKIKILLFILLIGFYGNANADQKKLMIMITDKNCLYCIVWEKQIGNIYPKTEIAKQYPLVRIEKKNNNDFKKYGLEKINLTPTFIFLKDNKQIGRIKGYTNPEMFWWQVDEIIDD